jgi:hypothetical protein
MIDTFQRDPELCLFPLQAKVNSILACPTDKAIVDCRNPPKQFSMKASTTTGPLLRPLVQDARAVICVGDRQGILHTAHAGAQS